MRNMLCNIASCKLAVLHRYFSATGKQFNNHTDYVYLETRRETDTTVVIQEPVKVNDCLCQEM